MRLMRSNATRVRFVRRAVRRLGMILATAGAFVPAVGHAADVVVSNWGVNLYGVIYAVGIEKGIFKEFGAPVTGAIGAPGGGSVMRAMLANEIKFGEIASSAVMDAQVKGLPIVVVGAMARSNDNAWYVLPSSPIKSLKDMIGKKVAYTSPKSISEAFARMIFERAGLDATKITLVAAGGYPQGLTMLDTGNVDVAAMAEPLKTQRKAKYREIFNAEDNLPVMTAVLAVTTRDYAAKNANILRAILAARRKAVEYVYGHPHEAGTIMAKAYNMKPDDAVACVENVVKMKQKLWLYGDINIDELTPMQKGLAMTGVNLDKVDWKKLIDISYLPDDLKAKSKLPK